MPGFFIVEVPMSLLNGARAVNLEDLNPKEEEVPVESLSDDDKYTAEVNDIFKRINFTDFIYKGKASVDVVIIPGKMSARFEGSKFKDRESVRKRFLADEISKDEAEVNILAHTISAIMVDKKELALSADFDEKLAFLEDMNSVTVGRMVFVMHQFNIALSLLVDGKGPISTDDIIKK